MSLTQTYEIRDRLEPGAFGDGIEIDQTLSGASERPRARAEPSALLPRHFAFFFSAAPGGSESGPAAALHVLRSHGAAVAGRDGVLLFPTGWVDRVQLYFVNYGREGCRFSHPDASTQTIRTAAPERRLQGEWFLGFNAAYQNYAHWMMDGLPGLVAYRERYMHRGCRLLLPRVPDGHFIDQMLQLLDIGPEHVERLGDETVEVETLYYLSHFHYVQIPDYALSAQRVLKAAVGDLPAARSRRIFVSRPDSGARRLLNEPEVLQALAPLEIEVMAPGLLSVAEQVRIFHAADLVVGPHGAGLANCGFCEPGSSLLELFSEYTTHSLFWIVASAARMRYGFVAGSSIDQDWAAWSEAENWSAPFVLDPRAVADGVRRITERHR